MANEASLKNFWVLNDFSKGFRDKVDVVAEEPGVAVTGSQNIQLVDNTKIGNRPGFSYLGARTTDRYGIIDGGSWKTNTADELALRSYSNGTNGIVQVYSGGAWETLIDTLATQGAKFLNKGAGVLQGWWSTTEVLDLLLFVDGSDSIFMWSGGETTIASTHTGTTSTITATTIAFVNSDPDTITDSGNGFVAAGFVAGDTIIVSGSTSNDGTYTIATVAAGTLTLTSGAVLTPEGAGDSVTITAQGHTLTKEGSTTWAEERFLTAGTRQVRIKDDSGTWRTFAYTGGEGTTTLTGVTPDPGGFTISAGNLVFQAVRETQNKPADGLSNDFMGLYLNYLFVFDKQRNTVQMSKNTDYTDFSSPSSPRIAGEAASFVLDEMPTAAITQPDGDAFYISTKNQWYQFVFDNSSDLTKEEVLITPLKTSALEGAAYELAVTNMKNYTVYTSGEPTIDNLGRVENIDTPQSVPLSDPIKNYVDNAGFTTSSSAYYKNNFYISLRDSSGDSSNNRILIRNLRLGSWETPWTIPASVVFEYGGSLYAHDSATLNTYALLDSNFADNYVSSTNQAPIASRWYSSHYDFGAPFNQKEFTVFWIDGYIRANTELKIYFTYDFGQDTKTYTLSGLQDKVVIVETGGGLGYYSLGQRSLGGRGETLSESGLRRFRGFIPVPHRPFYELQVSFQSEGAGYRWEVVRYGLNVAVIKAENNNIKISNV